MRWPLFRRFRDMLVFLLQCRVFWRRLRLRWPRGRRVTVPGILKTIPRVKDALKKSMCVFKAGTTVFYKKLKNVSCEYDRLNGWNSTLQAAWYIRHVRIICFFLTKPTMWLLLLSFTQKIVPACSMFYPYEGYRSVTPLDAARVNRTIFHKHSVHWYYNPHKG